MPQVGNVLYKSLLYLGFLFYISVFVIDTFAMSLVETDDKQQEGSLNEYIQTNKLIDILENPEDPKKSEYYPFQKFDFLSSEQSLPSDDKEVDSSNDENQNSQDEENEDSEDKKEFEDLLLLLKINYVETNIVSGGLTTPEDEILLPRTDLNGFNISEDYLSVAETTINGITYVNINKLPKIEYKVDYNLLTLDMKLPAEAMELQKFDIWGDHNSKIKGYRGTDLHATSFNYDITFSHFDKDYYAAGVNSIHRSTAKGYYDQSFFVKRYFNKKHKDNTLVRLDTSWTSDYEDKMSSLRVGDSITSSPNWGSSTRFGGIQYATDFNIKPNLITYPLINFEGRADLPSAIDIYSNSNLIYRSEIDIGGFEMDNIPVSLGKGALQVKQIDLSGKVQTISIPYYVVPELLKKDLVEYSYSLGSQRDQYSLKSNKYKYLVSSITYSKGINDNWTCGIHSESMKDIFAVGVHNIYKIGNYGVVSASIANSGPHFANANKVVLNYSFNSDSFGFGLETTKASKNFYNTFNLSKDGIKSSLQGSINYPLTKKSSIGLNYLEANTSFRNNINKVRTISANYNTTLSETISFNASSGKTFSAKDSFYAAISVLANLKSCFVSTSSYIRKKERTDQLFISSNNREYNGLSYSGNFSRDAKDKKRTNYDTKINYSAPKLNTTLFFFDYGSGPVQQFEVQGAATFVSGETFFSKPVQNSFAIVKTGDIKDVDVYHNNHFITKTNKKGIAFVPDVIPNVDSRVMIDENTVPLNTQFGTNTIIINPKRKSGVLADFEIAKIRIAEIILQDQKGDNMEQDSLVDVEGLEEQDLFVGYDGKLYISDVKELKHIKGSACDRLGCCKFEVSLEGMDETQILDLGVVKCEGYVKNEVEEDSEKEDSDKTTESLETQQNGGNENGSAGGIQEVGSYIAPKPITDEETNGKGDSLQEDSQQSDKIVKSENDKVENDKVE